MQHGTAGEVGAVGCSRAKRGCSRAGRSGAAGQWRGVQERRQQGAAGGSRAGKGRAAGCNMIRRGSSRAGSSRMQHDKEEGGEKQVVRAGRKGAAGNKNSILSSF